MSDVREPGDDHISEERTGLSAEQLRALQWGVAATVMPVQGGWRVHYFSIPAFDDEPGTDFPTFADAVAAIIDVLPDANSDDQRARAHAELQDWLRRRSKETPSDDALS